jgi:hypothetical protein
MAALLRPAAVLSTDKAAAAAAGAGEGKAAPPVKEGTVVGRLPSPSRPVRMFVCSAEQAQRACPFRVLCCPFLAAPTAHRNGRGTLKRRKRRGKPVKTGKKRTGGNKILNNRPWSFGIVLLSEI